MPDLAYVSQSLNVICFKKIEVVRDILFLYCIFAFSIVYHIFTYHCALQSSLFDYFQFTPQDFVILTEYFKTFYSSLILFFPPQIYLLPLEVEKSNFNHVRNSSFQTSTCCSAYKTYMSGICNYHNSVSCHRNISALQHYRNRMTCIMKDFKIHPRHLFSSP